MSAFFGRSLRTTLNFKKTTQHSDRSVFFCVKGAFTIVVNDQTHINGLGG